MMNTVTHEVAFSYEQPDQVLSSMLKLIHQRLRQPAATPTSREMIVRKALTVLVIDNQQERAQYVASLFVAVGYRPMIVPSALDAYTLFLQGECVPLAIILGGEDASNRLFLVRLVQQVAQKYNWEIIQIRLLQQKTNQPSFPSTNSWNPPSTESITPFGNPTTPRRESKPSYPPIMPPPATPSSLSLPPLSRPEQMTYPTGPQSVNNQMSMPAQMPTGPQTLASHQMPTGPQNSTGPQALFGGETAQPTFDEASLQSNNPKVYRLDTSFVPQKQKISIENQSIGRYQIKMRLGGSPFSDVYQTYDRLREKESALKAIQTDIVPFYLMNDQQEEEVSAFQIESEILTRVPHPHILPIVNFGKSYVSGAPFIYKNMPLCPEGNLNSWMYRNGGMGRFAFKDVLHIVLQMADALQHVHNHYLTYQNFKFSNIIVLNQVKNVQKLEVALSDFSIIQDGSFVPGTTDALAYLAPERWDGVSLPASDQYSLAAIAYELFTGRPPFQGNSERVLRILHTTKQAQVPTSVNPKLPMALNDVLMTALSKKPAERFASIAHFAQALQRC